MPSYQQIINQCFKHEVNPDGSTRTECMCVFPSQNRKCQFVAVRDPGGTLRPETIKKHLRKHHNEVFKEYDARRAVEKAEAWEEMLEIWEMTHGMKDQRSNAPNNSSN